MSQDGSGSRSLVSCSPEVCFRAAGIWSLGNLCLLAHHGRLLAGALRSLPHGPLHRLLAPWQPASTERVMEVAHTAWYGLISDSHTVSSYSPYERWVTEPSSHSTNGRGLHRAWTPGGHLRVWLLLPLSWLKRFWRSVWTIFVAGTL